MKSLVQEPGIRLIISQLSPIEIQSAFATMVRTGVIGKATLDQLRGLFFSDLANGRFEVALPARRHFHNAATLIRNHAADSALRTLDALQLCVALDLNRRGAALDIVASDKNLCNVAALEGLTVVNPLVGT